MRTGFVLSTIVLALALGILAGIAESRLLTRALIIGFAPAVWASAYVIERLTARGLWHVTAPYPYSWMLEDGAATTTPPSGAETPVEDSRATYDRSTFPLAA